MTIRINEGKVRMPVSEARKRANRKYFEKNKEKMRRKQQFRTVKSFVKNKTTLPEALTLRETVETRIELLENAHAQDDK